ncbi:uncharacterized protein LOC135344193 isoform X2 [Halichondria panicea]
MRQNATNDWKLQDGVSPIIGNIGSSFYRCKWVSQLAHLQCSCQTESCEDKTTTAIPETPTCSPAATIDTTTPLNNTSTTSEAILGSATGLLLVVLVGVTIGWICTCIVMRRRHGQYHINHRHTDANGYTYAHSTTSTPHPAPSCEAPDTTYSSLGQTYETIPPRVVQSFETLTVNESYEPARSIAKDDDTYSKLDNSVTRRQGDSEPHRVMDKYQQRVDSRIDYSTQGQDELVEDSYSKLADSKLVGDDSYSKLAGAASKRYDYYELEPQGLQSSADQKSFKIVMKGTECAGEENTIEGAGGREGSVCSEGAEDYEVPIKGNVEDA